MTPEFLDIYNYISKDRSRHSIFLHYFLALEEKPALKTTEEEADAEVVWFSRDESQSIFKDPEFVEKIFSHL